MFRNFLLTAALALPVAFSGAAQAQLPAGGSPAQGQLPVKKPNIVVIMGDDIGWFNLGSYNSGMMLNATPDLDTLATQGMRLTDYYAEASCTAGRANFITGELPIRTGLTTVGQAGSALGMPDAAPTIANALRSRRAMRPASSAKIILATAMPCCRRRTASTNSSDISTI